MTIIKLIPLAHHFVYRLATEEERVARDIEEVQLVVVDDIERLVSKTRQSLGRLYIGV